MPMQPNLAGAGRAGLAVIAISAMLACCDRQSPAVAPPPVASVSVPLPPKPTYTLIMTWMYGAQPPQTTQTVFHDEAACDQARDAAIAEGRRLSLESFSDAPVASSHPAPSATRRYVGSALLPGDEVSPPPPAAASQSSPPKVAAICAVTSTP